MTSIGIDFGTTNTVIAVTDAVGRTQALQFKSDKILNDVYRSVLCFEKREDGSSFSTDASGGMEAINAYLTSSNDVRFIQSLKSHAASRLFEETRVFGSVFKYPDLMSQFLQCATSDLNHELEFAKSTFVSGRPVAFVGNKPDDALAMQRYDAAFQQAGYPIPKHSYEPVGAAFNYAQTLQKDATILVGDFGGGTSDFSIMRFERENGKVSATPIGYSGLGIAGDRFDFRIIDAVISPKLGKNGQYRSFDKVLAMPRHYYSNFAKWHQLALLKNEKTLKGLRDLAKNALVPEEVEALIETIVDDRGFDIYQAVSKAKVQLSSSDSVQFSLRLGSVNIEHELTKADFEQWISPELEQISTCVDDLLLNTGLGIEDIDHVFLTGGSSFIPSVREIFQRRFGYGKMSNGNEFQSVALGLAQIGLEDDISPWLAD